MVVICPFLCCHFQLSGKWSNRNERKVKLMTEKADLNRITREENEKERKRMFTNPPRKEKDKKREKDKECLPILQSRKRIKRERKKEKEESLPILQSRKPRLASLRANLLFNGIGAVAGGETSSAQYCFYQIGFIVPIADVLCIGSAILAMFLLNLSL